MNSNHAVLAAVSRNIDRVSIVDMKGVDLADALEHYQARSTKLGMIIPQLLKEAKLTNYFKSLKATIETNDGVLLMDSTYKHLQPLATNKILEVLTEIGHCM